VLAGALILLFLLRRGVVLTLLCAPATGVIIALTAGVALRVCQTTYSPRRSQASAAICVGCG